LVPEQIRISIPDTKVVGFSRGYHITGEGSTPAASAFLPSPRQFRRTL